MELSSYKQELVTLEEAIAQEQVSFERVGTALKTIRAKELYKPKYQSFDAYTKARWDMQRRYVDYLIKSADVMSILRENNCSQLPACESQVRPLTKLAETQQIDAWQEVLKRAQDPQKITAKLVNQVVQEVKQQAETKQVQSFRLTLAQLRILKAIATLEQSKIGTLREFIFSEQGEHLGLPTKANRLLQTLQYLELDSNSATRSTW